MPEEVVHKIYTTISVAPVPLAELVLCGNASKDVQVSKSINHVTCTDCWQLWKAGIYK